MKKLFVISIIATTISLCSQTCFASETTNEDLWDNWNSNDPTYGQNKNVSDEEFDKVIEQLKEKRDKKIRKKQIPKGEEFHQSNETEIINEQEKKDSLPIIGLPIDIEVDEGILPVGHYQVKGIKNEDGSVSIELYQAHFVMARFPATETNDDFGEESITFAKWLPEGDDYIKIIFGSIDLNAFAIIKIK